LREYLLEESRDAGIAGPEDEVMITNGCQQALDLLVRVLLRPGDVVAVEDPVYAGLKNLFLAAGIEMAGIPVGTAGMDIDALRRTHPRMIVVTPNFQNPTGTTLPLASRPALLAFARESGAVVIENDTYGALRYSGEALASIKSLDDSGGTVLLRSFSKVSFPGLRVGWITGPKTLLARLAEAKHWCDLHSDQLSQAVMLRFAETGRLETHRRRIVRAGVAQLGAALEACERHLPQGSRFTRPEGGMNLWVTLPAPLNASDLLERARRSGADYLPGRYFEVSRRQPQTLRISFAGVAPERIRKGVAILGEVFRSGLEQARPAPRFEPAAAIV
jgi:2-aminoadipate transaminase